MNICKTGIFLLTITFFYLSGAVKKIVLTGGPGVGKTSIILALKVLGEHVVEEASTDYIKFKQASGIQSPWDEEDFQDGILQLQKQSESRIDPKAPMVFIDRGLYDGLAYHQRESYMYQKILREARLHVYDIVFIIEPLDFIVQNGVRRETKKESETIGRKLKKIYREAGYRPIPIKKGTLAERASAILDEVERRS